MFYKIRRLFYSRTSEIITDIVRLQLTDPAVTPTWYSGNRLNAYSVVYLVIAIALIIRMATFTLAVTALELPEYSGIAAGYLSVELNSGLFYRHLIQERFTGLLMVPYTVNNVAILAYTLLIPNKPLWNFVHDYLVNNGAQFWMENSHFKISFLDMLKNPFQTVKKVANILQVMWWRRLSAEKSPRKEFKVHFHTPLAHLVNYSHQTRSRTLLLHLFMEIVFFFVQIIAGILLKLPNYITFLNNNLLFYVFTEMVYIFALAYHFRLAYGELPAYQCLLAVLDMAAIIWMIGQCITLLFFAILTLIVGGFMVSSHLLELNRVVLDRAISSLSNPKNEFKITVVPKVAFFLEEHLKVVQLAVMLNRTLIRNLLSILSISAVLSTIYMISCLTFLPLSPFIRACYTTYLGMYAWLVVLSCSPFIFTVELLHSCAPRLFKLQSNLLCGASLSLRSGVVLSAKLKLLTAYELLHTDDKFYFTIGQFAKINRKSLFEVGAFLR